VSLELFETKPPLTLLARFAWPSILSLLANALYNVVDRAFVGQLVGTEALTAVSVVFPLTLALLAVAIGLGSGTATVVSLALGKKDRDEAEGALGRSLGLGVVLSAALALVLIPTTDPLLRLLGTPAAIVAPARDFFLTTLWGMPFLTLSIGLGMAIRSQGRAKTSMVTGLVGIGLNIVFCALFVGVWGWGLAGSAWATVGAQVLGALVTLGFYFTPLSHLRLRASKVGLGGPLTGRIVAYGAPGFLFQAISVVLMFVLNARVQAFGAEKALAAVGVINTLGGLFFMPVVGLVQGAVPLFGYYQGAGRPELNRRVFFWTLGLGTAFFTLCTLAVELAPDLLLSVFTRDLELRAFCLEPLRVFLILTPLAAFQVLPPNYFQALGKPGPALVISLIRPALLVAAVVVLPMFWGFGGFLAAGPVSDAAGVLAALAFLLTEKSLRRAPGPSTPSVDSQVESRP